MSPTSPSAARLALTLALAVTASLALASAAHAGFVPPFGGVTSCNDPTGVLADLADSNGVFADASSKRCRTLCKHAVADCKQYVASATSCRIAYWSDYFFYAKQGCIEAYDGAEEKDCIAYWAAGVSIQKTSIRDSRDSLSSNCETWGQTCLATCPP